MGEPQTPVTLPKYDPSSPLSGSSMEAARLRLRVTRLEAELKDKEERRKYEFELEYRRLQADTEIRKKEIDAAADKEARISIRRLELEAGAGRGRVVVKPSSLLNTSSMSIHPLSSTPLSRLPPPEIPHPTAPQRNQARRLGSAASPGHGGPGLLMIRRLYITGFAGFVANGFQSNDPEKRLTLNSIKRFPPHTEKTRTQVDDSYPPGVTRMRSGMRSHETERWGRTSLP
ncbi:hypothetical protein DPEC_G00243160 [Dallia pectoralis]|uniref:Uncharacterized protein n=1 Tax=Dallia pectoralis TaxID=75939 RepID=A0ACC2FV45_DALPE|nr:hypothetical protein DPEC_G00243160 [Dallia pectoralis]